jgi:hypothetical protein
MNNFLLGEEPLESDISLLSVNDLSISSDGGFEVAEKRKRKDVGGGREGGREGLAVGKEGRRQEGGRSTNTSVTNIKQKMRTMINVLEKDEAQREDEEEDDNKANDRQVYNSNSVNGKKNQNDEDDTTHMYNSTQHHQIPTRPNENRSPPHPSTHELYPYILGEFYKVLFDNI